MKKIAAALFCRDDSPYKSYPFIDVYDKARDARTFSGGLPVIAHPPCRAWGMLKHMARPEAGEKELAPYAVDMVRKNNGALEHPKDSGLWKIKNLPLVGGFPDAYGGICILINQYDFGHVASKPTILYIVGLTYATLPPMPEKRNSTPIKSMTGQVPGTQRCTQYEREYTPPALIDWIIECIRGMS